MAVRIKKLVCLVWLISIAFSMISYAEEDADLLPEGQIASINLEAADPRSFLIASREVSITNNEDGTLSVDGQILAHVTLDYARISLYVDKYVPETDDWVNVAYQNEEFTLAEKGDAFMGFPISTHTISGPGIEPGYYYKVRGTFLVMQKDLRESSRAETDGVLLTKVKK